MQNLAPVVRKESLYSVLNKGGKWDIKDILPMEDEFKCYLRPVIEDPQEGWGFLAANLKVSSSAIYPKIYNFRQQKRDQEDLRKENDRRIKRLIQDRE